MKLRVVYLAALVLCALAEGAETPTITWPESPVVAPGTRVTAELLNATASVPGTFEYSVQPGTVLSTGVTDVRVRFTPANPVNYTIATAHRRWVIAAGGSSMFQFTHLAGSLGGIGYVDGAASEARFSAMRSVAADYAGNLYVVDAGNRAIRQVTPQGHVLTLAGGPGDFRIPSSDDGPGLFATFAAASGIARDTAGNLYVSDRRAIRKIDATGAVTTLAGVADSSGSSDGTGGQARFGTPMGLAVDSGGNLYVADYSAHTIRKVTPSGAVTTLAGEAGSTGSANGKGSEARFTYPIDVAVGQNGTVYVADSGGRTIRAITPDGDVSTFAGSGAYGHEDGIGAAASFGSPSSVAVDAAGNVYVADTSNHVIRKITPDRNTTTILGNAADPQIKDGPADEARLFSPADIAVDDEGAITFVENNSYAVRRMSATTVSTIAGRNTETGNTDGIGSVARFGRLTAAAVDSLNNVYLADASRAVIRKISPDGQVTTWAGADNQQGSVDGTGAAARFGQPMALAIDGQDNIYVADSSAHVIRKISPTAVVSTLAGTPYESGSADGSGNAARFNTPQGIAVDADGALYVADSSNHAIRKITSTGIVTTLAGSAGTPGSADGIGSSARFNGPWAVAVDASGSVYVGDYFNGTLRRIALNGAVTTLAGLVNSFGLADGQGGAARFSGITSMVIGPDGDVFAAEAASGVIRRITPDGIVTTAAGSFSAGWGGGIGKAAKFHLPHAIAFDAAGNLYVADSGNGAVWKGAPLVVPTITWQPAPISVGSALSSSHLNASAEVAGTFEYSPSLGEIYDDDTPLFTARFMPADTSKYFPVAATVESGRTKQTPVISWASPASIGFGTPLSAIQLSACADVAGSFSYTPAIGTILPVGEDQELSVTFTPVDGARYTAATVTRTIDVFPTRQRLNVTAVIDSVVPGRFDSSVQAGSTIELTIDLWRFVQSIAGVGFFDAMTEISVAGERFLGGSMYFQPFATSDSSGYTLARDLFNYQWRTWDVRLALRSSDVSLVTLADTTVPDEPVDSYDLSKTLVLREGAGVLGSTYSEVLTATLVAVEVTTLPIDAPDNDDFANAEELSGESGVVAGRAIAATHEVNEPMVPGTSLYGSTWFAWTATADGPATFSLKDHSFVGQLIAYEGSSLATLTKVGQAVADGTLTFETMKGRRYQIMVDRSDTAASSYMLSWGYLHPRIEQQPIDAVTTKGSSASLSVVAKGEAPLSYQWRKSGIPLLGQIHPQLEIVNAQSDDAATYSVVVTNGRGQVTSHDAAVTVLDPEPPTFAGVYRGDFGGGGPWALHVSPEGEAKFIGYLAARQSAIVAEFRVDASGEFSTEGTEITRAVNSQSLPGRLSRRAAATSLPFTFSGSIHGTVLIAALNGLGEFFSGNAGAGYDSSTIAGSYTARAIGSEDATAHVIVGTDRDTVVITVGEDHVEVATGSLDGEGNLNSTTLSGGELSLRLNRTSGAVAATVIPLGATAPVTFGGLADDVESTTRLIAISTRSRAGKDDHTLIMGFVIAGGEEMQLVTRGVGPALLGVGVDEALVDPKLMLFDRNAMKIEENDDWGGSAEMMQTFARLGMSPALAANSKDAALVRPTPAGLYTAHVTTGAAESGISLIEVYDGTVSGESRFTALSTRTVAGPGIDTLIAGIVLEGNAPKRLLIRGVGPSLVASGVSAANVLQDPSLSVHRFINGSSVLVAENNNWAGADVLKTAFSAVGLGAFESDASKDAALLVTLAPGVYTVHVSTTGNASGVALVEIYEAP